MLRWIYYNQASRGLDIVPRAVQKVEILYMMRAVHYQWTQMDGKAISDCQSSKLYLSTSLPLLCCSEVQNAVVGLTWPSR